MNAKLEKFLSEKRELKALEAKKKRDEHLISLGLIDEVKMMNSRKYSEYWSEKYPNYDKNKDLYYCDMEQPSPIEISDEEYEEILKIAPLSESVTKKEKSFGFCWAGCIKILAYLNLFLGVLLNLFLITNIDKPFIARWLYNTTGVENPELVKKLAEQAQMDCIESIIYIVISFPFIIAFSKIVAAAEKYLRK